MVILLMTQMIPLIFNMSSIFLMMVKLKLANSLFGICLLHIASGLPYNSLMMKSFIGGIPREIDEAAAIDGCGRIRRIFYITLPNLLPTVMILWITNMSGLFSASFDASYMLGNATTANVAEVIETYIYKMGLSMGMYSYSTAVSLIQTVLGFALVWLTNKLAQKTTDYSLW